MPGGALAVLPRVGSLIEGPAFHPFLTGQGNLARCDAADRTADPRTARARIGEVLARLGLASPQVTGEEVSARLDGQQAERICAELVGAGVGVRGFGVAAPALEELFVGLTGEGFDVDA